MQLVDQEKTAHIDMRGPMKLSYVDKMWTKTQCGQILQQKNTELSMSLKH